MSGRVRARDCVIGLRDLPSPPDVYARLNELLDQPDWTMSRIAEVLEGDPSVAARVLRLANSPVFGAGRSVDSLSQAVTLLGLTELRQLVLATTVLTSFPQISGDLISLGVFREKAVYTAAIGGVLAAEVPGADAARVFLASLLHDIGSIVVCLQLPERARQVLVLRAPRHGDSVLFSLERAVMGSELNEVGGALLEHWGVPSPLRESVLRSPRPDTAALPAEPAVVHLACRTATAMEAGETDPLPPEEDVAWALAGLDRSRCLSLPPVSVNRARELLSVLSR